MWPTRLASWACPASTSKRLRWSTATTHAPIKEFNSWPSKFSALTGGGTDNEPPNHIRTRHDHRHGFRGIEGNAFALGQYGKATALIQVDVETSVTSVTIEGRESSTSGWYPVTTFVGTDVSEVPVMPEMRAVITDADGLITVTSTFI